MQQPAEQSERNNASPVLPSQLRSKFEIISTNLNAGTTEPQIALNEALSVFNRLTEYGKLRMDPRVYKAMAIGKFASGAAIMDQISKSCNDDEDYEQETRVTAEKYANTYTSCAQTILDAHREVLRQNSMYTSYKVGFDVRDYTNTTTASSVLFEEQWSAEMAQIVEDKMPQIDGELIMTICGQRLEFVKAHQQENLADKENRFKALLESLSKTNLTLVGLDQKGLKLNIARAMTHTLTAKTLHDLSMLGGVYPNTAERNEAILAAIRELWDADAALPEGPNKSKNDAIDGILKDIKECRVLYSKEIGLDPNVNPSDELSKDLTVENIVKQMGSIATANTPTP